MKLLAFKSFLSHRYKSPDVNQYFFESFKKIAEVQFEVDEGIKSTNVTRLERMIRNCDAFIGIYPLPNSPKGNLAEELKKQSQYFRLELDLAVRSQKPAIIFYDKRYGNILEPPDNIFSCEFDINEVTGAGGFPSRGEHTREFTRFCESVANKKRYDETRKNKKKNVVLLVLPEYRNIEDIKSLLKNSNFTKIEVVAPPISLDNHLYKLLEQVDFAIVDHGNAVAKSGIPAYLHGRFIPMIRAEHTGRDADTAFNSSNEFLFNGLEVGYNKDKIRWESEKMLLDELSVKLEILTREVRLIKTFEQAKTYFSSAELRKELVFVSYSGKDADIARKIITSLKKHFQEIFDYQDGESIVPGRPWPSKIFDTLAKSAIGISLLSDSYMASKNCMHELEQMVALMDSGKLNFFPVKLYPGSLNRPNLIGTIQDIKVEKYGDIDSLVNKIAQLSAVDNGKK